MTYRIIGVSRFGREELDTADTKKEAEYLVREYRMAFGAGWDISIKRGRNETTDDEEH